MELLRSKPFRKTSLQESGSDHVLIPGHHLPEKVFACTPVWFGQHQSDAVHRSSKAISHPDNLKHATMFKYHFGSLLQSLYQTTPHCVLSLFSNNLDPIFLLNIARGEISIAITSYTILTFINRQLPSIDNFYQ